MAKKKPTYKNITPASTSFDLSSLIFVVVLLVPLFIFCSISFYRNVPWLKKNHLLEDIVSKSGGKLRPHHNLGASYSIMGLNEKAIGLYLKAIELDPEGPEPYTNIGAEYSKMGNHQKGIEYLKIGLEKKEDNRKSVV